MSRPGLATTAVLLLLSCRPGDLVPSALPGAPPLSRVDARSLIDALASKGAAYHPHTRHFDEVTGRPRYTNRLIRESSPYLLQHAHNPVDWWPWGDAAFARARELGRPVLLSVGYSTCHWCHVMERESFEDEAVARYLNEHYICIKVDREQLPDVDATYMAAVQQLSGSGGWPMNVWLTPAREPFFGGTYFPPRDGERGARKGLLTIARELAEKYTRDPKGIAAEASELARVVRVELAGPTTEGATPISQGRAPLDAALMQVRQNFDPVDGGLRRAPKFPSSLPLRLLLREQRRTGSAALLGIIELTLEKMAGGGIYDQLGGGFHRYATDARWLVPHFEKMLYDNALLAIAYAEAYAATGRGDYARVATETLQYLVRDLAAPDGGFTSASDADSEGVEGKYFVWDRHEVDALLGDESARFAAYYDVTPSGNWEGRNILHAARPSEGEWAALAGARRKLLAAREKRVPPDRDDKQLAAWNGLAISALAVGGRVLAEPRWLEAARRAARFVLGTLRRADGSLARSCTRGVVTGDGYLEDYALVIAGLIDLYEASFEVEWLRAALALAGLVEERFADPRGGWFETTAGSASPMGRVKPAYDGAEPSGPSVMALDLLRLATLTDDARWSTSADRALAAYAAPLARAPLSLSEMLLAVAWRSGTPREIVIVWPDGQPPPESLLTVLRTTFVPARVITGGPEGKLAALQQIVPLVEGKRALAGQPTAYVCIEHACLRPTSDPLELAKELTAP